MVKEHKKKFRETVKKFAESKIGKVLFTILFTGLFLLLYTIVFAILVDKVILEKYVGSRKTTEVPYLTGLRVEECAKILSERKLKWNTVGTGKYVWKTEPPSGMVVKVGRIIHLYLSDNPRGGTP